MKIKNTSLIVAVLAGLLTGSALFAGDAEVLVCATFVNGEVLQIRAGKANKVKVNQIFSKDDTIQTKKGKVDIQLGPNIVIRLSSFSVLKMQELLEVGDSQKIKVALESGSLYSKLIKKLDKNSEYNVVSDTSVAGVRGTEFLMSDPDPGTKGEDGDVPPGTFVNDGSVEVSDPKNPSKKFVVNKGEEVVANGGELKKGILEEFIQKKMEIFKTLDVMKEENYKALKEQKEAGRKQLDAIRGMKPTLDN